MAEPEYQVVILNDGETYTSRDGCVILTIPVDVDEDDLDAYVKENAFLGQQV